jgi:hypothetical protein
VGINLGDVGPGGCDQEWTAVFGHSRKRAAIGVAEVENGVVLQHGCLMAHRAWWRQGVKGHAAWRARLSLMQFKHRKELCYVGTHSDSFLMEQLCLAQSTGCGFIALAIVSPFGSVAPALDDEQRMNAAFRFRSRDAL